MRLPETAEDIENFSNYKLSDNSSLRKSGINRLDVHKIQNGGFDFNGEVAPAKGIGASF